MRGENLKSVRHDEYIMKELVEIRKLASFDGRYDELLTRLVGLENYISQHKKSLELVSSEVS